MNEEIRKCPSCGEEYDDELLIVCLSCGAELHSGQSGNAPVKYGPFTAYKAMFKKTFDFRGRSGRAEYWFAYLVNAIIFAVLAIALVCVDFMAAKCLQETGVIDEVYVSLFNVIDFVFLAYAFVLLIPQLSLIVRRLHDSGLNGAFALLSLVGVVGTAILMILLARRGNTEINDYGPPV